MGKSPQVSGKNYIKALKLNFNTYRSAGKGDLSKGFLYLLDLVHM